MVSLTARKRRGDNQVFVLFAKRRHFSTWLAALWLTWLVFQCVSHQTAVVLQRGAPLKSDRFQTGGFDVQKRWWARYCKTLAEQQWELI